MACATLVGGGEPLPKLAKSLPARWLHLDLAPIQTKSCWDPKGLPARSSWNTPVPPLLGRSHQRQKSSNLRRLKVQHVQPWNLCSSLTQGDTMQTAAPDFFILKQLQLAAEPRFKVQSLKLRGHFLQWSSKAFRCLRLSATCSSSSLLWVESKWINEQKTSLVTGS